MILRCSSLDYFFTIHDPIFSIYFREKFPIMRVSFFFFFLVYLDYSKRAQSDRDYRKIQRNFENSKLCDAQALEKL